MVLLTVNEYSINLMMENDNDELKNAYKEVGRHTEAGRALYRLYNKGKTPYTPEVRVRTNAPTNPLVQHKAKIREKNAAIKAAKEKYSHKRVVARPDIDPDVLLQYKLSGTHRKQGNVIEAEQKNDPLEMPHFRPSKSRESAITEAQNLMEYRGKLPACLQKSNPKHVLTKCKPQVGTDKTCDPLDELDSLSFQITHEIEEREQFLDEMAAAGKRQDYQPSIQHEIAQRKSELAEIEKLKSQPKK